MAQGCGRPEKASSCQHPENRGDNATSGGGSRTVEEGATAPIAQKSDQHIPNEDMILPAASATVLQSAPAGQAGWAWVWSHSGAHW